MNRRALATAGVAALAVALTACTGVEMKPVEGARDDLRYTAPVYKIETKQVDVFTRTCTTSKGVTKCRKVKTGTRPETKNVLKKAEKWCVELDNVNGDQSADDRWFKVDAGTHQLASEMVEGTSIKFTPLAEGC